MEKSRIEKQFDFIKEIDKEKFIIRQMSLFAQIEKTFHTK